MAKLSKKLKNRWVKALRSGEYEQGKGSLRKAQKFYDETAHEVLSKEDSYCCLGVLCDIVEPNNWRKVDDMWSNTKAKLCTGMPRLALQEELGLSRPAGHFGDSVAEKLAHMNDQGKSFKFIANWIEKHL